MLVIASGQIDPKRPTQQPLGRNNIADCFETTRGRTGMGLIGIKVPILKKALIQESSIGHRSGQSIEFRSCESVSDPKSDPLPHSGKSLNAPAPLQGRSSRSPIFHGCLNPSACGILPFQNGLGPTTMVKQSLLGWDLGIT
jgi:hypothetical protein